jgi:acetoin utilization deacetylase AcuC-like enzyme
MAYEKAAVRHTREAREQREQDDRARIDAVIAEFGGDTDAPAALTRMAQALLDYRHLLQQFIDAGEMIQQGKPFIVMGPGPHWKPDLSKQWPRR